MKNINGKGQVTISRVSSAMGDDYICLRIQDGKSGITFVNVNMSVENFGYAITGLGSIECNLEFNKLDCVGMKRESKEISVPVIEVSTSDKSIKASLLEEMVTVASLAPFEVDGWKARKGDFGNHHRFNRHSGESYRVVFERHVNEE